MHDDNAANNFNILAISLNVLHNYFNCLTLFSDLYLIIKFLNTSAMLSMLSDTPVIMRHII